MKIDTEEALSLIAARLGRIERMLEQQQLRPDPANLDLVDVLADFTGREWFTARELWAAISSTCRACDATGEPSPYLVKALNNEGITTAKALGWWLSHLAPDLIEKGPKGRDGLLWQFK